MKRIALCDLHPAELPAVEVRDLRVDGDEAPILAGVTFSLAQGEPGTRRFPMPWKTCGASSSPSFRHRKPSCKASGSP